MVAPMSRAALVVLLLAAACSKKQPAGTSTGSGSGTAAPAVDAAAPDDAGTAAAAKWDDHMSKDAKSKFMRANVVQPMKTAFQGFDAKDFAKFNCKTCHGKGAITKEYKMPNPDLPKLDFAELKAGKHAEMVKFMKEQVTPKVAEILGLPERSRTNPDGFGCLNCHEEKK